MLSKQRTCMVVTFIWKIICIEHAVKIFVCPRPRLKKSLRTKELMKQNLSTSHKCPHPQVFINYLIINLLTSKTILFNQIHKVHKVCVIILLFMKSFLVFLYLPSFTAVTQRYNRYIGGFQNDLLINDGF